MKNLFLLLTIFIVNSSSLSLKSEPDPVLPVPTEAQLKWHEMEKYAFIHFTTNTFTGKEWGYGDESPSVFYPTAINVDQWISTIKDAGLKGVVLTCKHHDGFVLWPSKFTEHSIKNSPYKEGKGDIVKEVADACKKYKLKFGVYLSPWDRNRADYGSSSYVTYYRNQLKEIFDNYGPIFEMWMDGANGGDGYYGGARDKRKINGREYYDWPNTIKLVRGFEPNILFFSDAGPEIRWVGNESGIAGRTNWNNITIDTLYAGQGGINDLLATGSENGKSWVPAEVDVSIRKGWFYHKEEDDKVKTPEKLFDIYMTSVGRGSNLILNIPPDRRGLIHENDVEALKGWKKLLDERFGHNLAKNAKISSSSSFNSNLKASNILDSNIKTYWAANEMSNTAEIEISFAKEQIVSYIQLQEYIKLGQRVKSFTISIWKDNKWKQVANETTIGYKRIVAIEPTSAKKLKIKIIDSKACPTISEIAVF